MIGTEFGPSEPLTTRLKNLVRSYPKGLGIFKEFIQNADDAEASKIIFVIDEQKYDVDNLPDKMSWLHQTPALLVFNNKPFNEKDVRSIQDLGASGKSQSIGKTGRFGLGFNSCFNVTDVPYFFTNGKMYFIDPHFNTIPEGSTLPGRCFSYEELKSLKWPLLNPFNFFIKESSNFEGTVFRLPFRTAHQVVSSKIKNEAYTISDAKEALFDLQRISSGMLLFLKHLVSIQVVHKAKDGTVNELISISTKNITQIRAAQHEVQNLLTQYTPEDILKKVSLENSVYSNCQHDYTVKVNNKEHVESWRVINGLFTDREQKILDTCREMLHLNEKALPLAGAAWPLSNESAATGRVFCFLPTPIQTSLPIQLNGYFDLDDSRQNFFLDQGAQGSAGLRVKWNKTLLETSVVEAYLKLIESLKFDLKDVKAYYNAFPVDQNSKPCWESWLTTAFYKHASKRALFKTSGSNPWKPISDIRCVPMSLNIVEVALIKENLLPIPVPSLPTHIKEGFRNNGINVLYIEPTELRHGLRENEDIDRPLCSAPKAYLSKQEYIEALFRFCMTDSPIEKDLKGLPLILDRRKHIRTLGIAEKSLYLSRNNYDQDIFYDRPKRFIDPLFIKNVDLREMIYLGIREMNDKRFISCLASYVNSKSNDAIVTLNTNNEEPLSDQWLQKVIKRLLESNLEGLCDSIKKVPLIPDQNKVFQCMGSTQTPLLYTTQNKDLRSALLELSVPLVTQVSTELFSLLLKLAKEKQLIYEVTPCDLLDTLEYREDIPHKLDFLSFTHKTLLDFFSSSDSLASIRSENRLSSLKKLCIYPTTKNTLIDLNRQAYISEGFDFPKLNFDIVLVNQGPFNRWHAIYEALNIPVLSLYRFTNEVLIPCIPRLNSNDLLTASEWLRDNINSTLIEANEESRELLEEVRNTPLIVCEDGQIRAPSSVYLPGPQQQLARDVLGDYAYFPDMESVYSVNKHSWLGFFRQLDMPHIPRLSDVFNYIKAIVDDSLVTNKAKRMEAVYIFLKEQVESDFKLNKNLSQEFTDILEEIAELPWIPVRQEPGDLLYFKTPQQELARPGEVIFPRDGQLVASQTYIALLPPRYEPDTLTKNALGFPSKPSIESVVKHFQVIINECKVIDLMPEQEVLNKVITQIYRFFGGYSSQNDNAGDTDGHGDYGSTIDLQEIFSEVPCIWDNGNIKFWRPKHVYKLDVGYMEPWRKSISYEDPSIERGLTALGRLHQPNIAEWKSILQEIAEDRLPLLDEKDSIVVNKILRRIVMELDNLKMIDSTVLVPTRTGILLPASEVYISNAPWYESIILTDNIPILCPAASSIPEVKRHLGLNGLAESITPQLTSNLPPDTAQDEYIQKGIKLTTIIRSEEFVRGIERLLVNEDYRLSDFDLSHFNKVSVRFVTQIETILYLKQDNRPLGNIEGDYFFDETRLIAMLKDSRNRFFFDDLAHMLNGTLGYSLKNLSPLIQMLKCDINEINTVLDSLKIRKYGFSPMPINDEDTQDLLDDKDLEGIATKDHFPDGETARNTDCAENNDEVMTTDKPAETDINLQGTHIGAPENSLHSETDHEILQSISVEPTSSASAEGPTNRPDGERSNGSVNSSKPQDTQGKIGREQSTASPRDNLHLPSSAEQSRLRSYVRPKEREGSNTMTPGNDNNLIMCISHTAVEIVLNYEKSQGRKPMPMPHNNAGYDVMSESSNGIRYIEVKGLEHSWGNRGVSLSSTQFNYATDKKDSFWLYVVENVFTEGKLYMIQNPSNLVNDFMFDGVWKEVAVTSEVKLSKTYEPSHGDIVIHHNEEIGIFKMIKKAGRITLVEYADHNGASKSISLNEVTIRPKGDK